MTVCAPVVLVVLEDFFVVLIDRVVRQVHEDIPHVSRCWRLIWCCCESAQAVFKQVDT